MPSRILQRYPYLKFQQSNTFSCRITEIEESSEDAEEECDIESESAGVVIETPKRVRRDSSTSVKKTNPVKR